MRRETWIDVVTAVVVLAGLLRIAAILPERGRENDFAHYYLASEVLWHGGQPYRTDLGPLYVTHDFVRAPELKTVIAPNPPLFVWLFVPISCLSPSLGFVVWVMVEALCLALVLGLTRRLLGRQLSARAWRGLGAGVLISDAVLTHFGYSQMGLLLAALVIGALVLLRAGRPAGAVVLVVTAGMLKLFPLALLPWFVWRGATTWTGRLKLAGIAALAVAGIVIVTGVGLWRDYVTDGLPVLQQLAVGSKNLTVPSLILNLGRSSPGARLVATGVGGLLLGGALVVSCRARGSVLAQFGLMTVAMVAGGLTAWSHYFVLLIVPVAVVVADVLAAPTRWRVVVVTILVALLNAFDPVILPNWEKHRVLQLLLCAMPQYGLVGLGIWLVRLCSANEVLTVFAHPQKIATCE